MSRKPRLEAEGLHYHIISRGIESSKIFRDERDYTFFIDRLGEILVDTKTEVLSFCLMPNHFHLLLKSTNIPVSTVMRRLLTGYAVVFNRRYKRVGHLFSNRYKSIICQEDPYLLELIRYIHLNPIRAKIVSSIEALRTYPWVGHGLLLKPKKYDWYPPERVLAYFGKTERKSRSAYLRFVTDGLSMGKNPNFTGSGLRRPSVHKAFDDRILGDGDFVSSVIEPQEIKRGGNEDISFESLLIAVAKEYHVDVEEIKRRLRTGKIIAARAAVVYLAVSNLGLTFAECARGLQIHRASAARLAAEGKQIISEDQTMKLLKNATMQPTSPSRSQEIKKQIDIKFGSPRKTPPGEPSL